MAAWGNFCKTKCHIVGEGEGSLNKHGEGNEVNEQRRNLEGRVDRVGELQIKLISGM